MVLVSPRLEALRVAVLGCGFWSRFQIPAWLELRDVRVIGVCVASGEKAEAAAKRFDLPAFYSDPLDLVAKEKPDLLDVMTSPETHQELVHLAARSRLPVICQKPMANDLETAMEMVRACRGAGVPFFVHENWRWQRPLRELKRTLDSGAVVNPFVELRAPITPGTYAWIAPGALFQEQKLSLSSDQTGFGGKLEQGSTSYWATTRPSWLVTAQSQRTSPCSAPERGLISSPAIVKPCF